MKRLITPLLVMILISGMLNAQDQDTVKNKKKEKIKTGFSLGGVPVVAYDADIGFKYGALVNLYWFGDGSRYPMYDHSVYLEWSRTTKGNGINQITYDTDKLIPGIRSFNPRVLVLEDGVLTPDVAGNPAPYDGVLGADILALDTATGSVRKVLSLSDVLGDLTVDFERTEGGLPRWFRLWAVCGEDPLSVYARLRAPSHSKSALYRHRLYL